MTTKSAFPALYAPISAAWERGSPRVDRSALSKRVEGGNLSLNMAFIRWMSAYGCLIRDNASWIGNGGTAMR
jgi:hypothetical protein